MSEESPAEAANYHFIALVFSLASAAWAQLGKVPHPTTGKIERNLAQAKDTIDMLAMLHEKTAGQLTDKEKELIENSLAELELNFSDEVEKNGSENVKMGENGPAIIKPDDGEGPTIIRP